MEMAFIGYILQLYIMQHIIAIAYGNPGDVSALIGTRVTLQCTLPAAGTLANFNWRRETTQLGYWDLSLPVDEPVVEDGYEMTIDSSTGYSEFTIKAVDLDDDGRFFCNSGYAPTPPGGNPMDNMTVTVLAELDNIQIMTSNKEYTDGESVVVVDGNDNAFTCASQANKPEALFDWTVAGKAPGSAPPTSKTPNADDVRLWDSTSDYTYTALWEHHGAAITCTAKNEALPSGINTSIVLDVKVPPKDGTVTLSDPAPYNNLAGGAVRQDIEHVFQCNVAGTRPESEISWRKGDQSQNGQKRVEQDGLLFNTFGNLNFVPNRNDHQLVLQCEADIEVTGAQTVIKQLTLDVYGPPDDPILTGDTEFIEQIESDLICNAANGFPGGGKINWFKDGTLIQNGGTDISNGDRFDIRDTYSLTPLRSDNGKLIRCQVQHETLKEPPYPATETTINVKFCPASVLITQCPSVAVGQSATLSCTSSSSNPHTSIEWYEKSDKVQNTDQPTYTPAEYNGFNTTQTQDTRVIDRDDYMDVEFSCCGVNYEAGCSQLCSDPCVLNVLYAPENVEVSKSPSDPVEEGAIITLTCTADGNPDPDKFTWHHDSSVDIGDGTDTLVLDSIEKGDSGYYTCVAENGISPDKASEQSAVIVHYSPIIEEETDSRGVNPGEDVTFDCKAEGLPNPAITWYNPEENTISNDTERMTIVDRIIFQDGVHGTVIVSNLRLEDVLESDYGTYVCQATNSIGQPDSLRVHLNGTTVPEPVKALNITEVTLNSITVEWTAGYSGGEKLEQSFVVDFRRYTDNTVGEWSEAIEITNGDTHYQVTGLLEETKYDIRVFSKNDIGRNENGQITTGSTGYGEPITPTADVRTGPVVDPSTGPVIDPNIGGIVGGVIVSIAAITVVAILIIYFRKQIFGDMFIETKRTNRANESFRQVVYSKNEVEMTVGIDNNTSGNEHDEQSALALKDECYANVSTLRFAFPRNNLNIVKELGHGEFGRVLMAEAKGLLQDGYTSTVAVKTLKGGRPYTGMNSVEIRQLLRAGKRMPQPKHCSQQLYTIMSMCWEKNPKNRPTFVQLINLLEDIIVGQMGYLSMEDLETALYEDSSAPDANEKI